ncbi:UDP-glycosyltransferase 83A1 [Glycine soja]|uniref:UDP-glycosyltransferase 83A1 n=1 Tax=Glycine soja TaxID=3848 RepID=A0A0B2QZW1_GLYSO|nr:UDP-glycosyltransferase 83A1 [Glycine soja]
MILDHKRKQHEHSKCVDCTISDPQGQVNPLMNFSQKLVGHGCKITFVNTDFTHKRVMSSMAKQESLHGSPMKLVSILDGLGPDDDRSDVVGSKLGIKGVLFWTASATMFALQYNIFTLIEDGIIDSDVKFTINNI